MPKVIPDAVYYDDQLYKNGQGDEVVADTHREFEWQGKSYITYCTQENADELDEFMARITEFATAVQPSLSSTTRSSSSRSSSSSGGAPKAAEKAENRKIREWCVSQQMNISKRGRIPDWAKTAYFDAHPQETPVVPISA